MIGTVRPPPENVAQARQAMERVILASRAEDGCFKYAYAADVEPGLIHVKEIWRDRASLDAHLLQSCRRLARYLAGPGHLGRALSLYEVGKARRI